MYPVSGLSGNAGSLSGSLLARVTWLNDFCVAPRQHPYMFTEDRDKRDVAVGVLVVALIAGSLWIYSRVRETGDVGTASAVPTSPAPATRSQVETVAYREPVATRVVATVYECSAGGQRILSDHPCGVGARAIEVTEPNRMDAQDTRILYQSSPRPRRVVPVPALRQANAPSNRRACDRIQYQIDAINAQMRQGYRHEAGELFRAQLRSLNEQQWEAGCGRP